MSVAVYLPEDEFHVAELIKLHRENENLRKYADFHIVFESSVSYFIYIIIFIYFVYLFVLIYSRSIAIQQIIFAT